MSSADASPTAPDRSVALVLGSGGARGYAHIGVIDVLEAHGFQVAATSGCSMGAVIGGIHAAGKLDEYRQWVTQLRQIDVLRLVDLSLSAGGAIRGEKIISVVRDIIGDIRIEDLPIPYTAVATDLLTQREVWFQDGSLADAMRASVAIPSLFAPVVSGNQLLVDGALLNPVPILPTLAANASITVAVHLSGETRRHAPTRPAGPLSSPGFEDELYEEALEESRGVVNEDRRSAIRARAARFFDWDALRAMVSRDAGDELVPSTDPEISADVGRLEIMNLAFETMQAALTSYKLAGYPPDVLVEIPKSAARTFEFHRAAELIEVGRQHAEAALEAAGLIPSPTTT